VVGSARLTLESVNYSVLNINNRESRLISKKVSLRSPFPFISTYAASVRITRCYVAMEAR
jgi:hypothetical protein